MLLFSHISIIWFIFSLILYIETEYGSITVRTVTPETKANNKGLAFIGINYCKTEEEGIIVGQSQLSVVLWF